MVLSARAYLRWDAFRVDNFLKHVDHIVKLSMDVSDDNHGLLNTNHIWLVS